MTGLAVLGVTMQQTVAGHRKDQTSGSSVGYLLRAEHNLKPSTLADRVSRNVRCAFGI